MMNLHTDQFIFYRMITDELTNKSVHFRQILIIDELTNRSVQIVQSDNRRTYK
jgi:hypothetical protein